MSPNTRPLSLRSLHTAGEGGPRAERLVGEGQYGRNVNLRRSEDAMLSVDAQVHIWSQGTPSGQHRQISKYSAEDCLKEMDAAGVDAVVLHPPGWDTKGGGV